MLTGSTGQVGGALLETLASFGEVIAPARSELDLSHAASVRAFVRSVKPRWIVNPAAYTAVDKAESETAEAYAVNAGLPRVLGEEAASLGAIVLHFSTDYVFSGEGTRPWTEADQPAPQSIYGSTKLDGEHALAASGAAHMIFRTSWVYGATGKNFLRTILKAARERPELRIVADQYGAPTWSRDLARLTAQVITQIEALAEQEPSRSLADVAAPLCGIYHACGQGETTWFGFAKQAVVQESEFVPNERLATLTPITTAEYPTPARRPANSRMDGAKLGNTFGFQFPPWEESLRAVLAELRMSAAGQ